MYSVNLIKKDIKKVEAMMNVISEFADGRPFRFRDIPKEKLEKYYTYTVNPSWYYGRPYKVSVDFGHSTMHALCERGLVEVIAKEEYTWTDEFGEEHKNGRSIYKCTGKTIDDYKSALALLIPKAILA